MGLEKRDKSIVGNESGLGETVHAASNFDVDVAIVEQWAQVIVFNDGVGEHPNGDTHILISFHWRAEIEIFEIRSQELCIWCGDDAVDQEFGGCQVGSFCADFEWVVHFVAADCPTYAIWIRFLRAQCGDDAEVGALRP